MKKALLFFLVGLPLSLFSHPQTFKITTKLKASQNQTLFFKWKQVFELEADLLSHETLLLTFQRLQASGHFEGQTFEIDSDAPLKEHFDELSLSQWLHHPFKVSLDAHFQPPKNLLSFDQFLKLHPECKDFAQPVGLRQIINALLSPKQFNPQKNTLSLSFFYPTPFKCQITPNHSPQTSQTKLFFDQDLELLAPCLLQDQPTQLPLSGDLVGEIIWASKEDFVTKYFVHQVLGEKSSKSLESSPLQFEYSFLVEKI